MKSDDKKESRVLILLGILPVVWLALLTSPFFFDGILSVIEKLPEAIQHPFRIQVCKDSLKTVLIFIACYGMGIGIYLSTRRNYRRGEEYGSAQWGNTQEINKKYSDKKFEANKLMTKHVRISYNSRKHRRNLLTIVVGGSGAGKTRFFCKPNLMQANTSFAVRSFILTAQGRDFAILTVQKPISRQKKRRNALPKRASTPFVKRSARFAASPSGRPTVRRCCAPRNVKPSTADRSSLPIITVSNPSRKPEKQYKFKEEHTMEKFITDERTGLQYELVGDYYLVAGEDEPEGKPIGVWGQRHLRYLKQHRKVLYSELLISGKLNDYLADINEQAEEMFSRLVKQLAEKEGVTEALKAENQMLWVQKMNNIRNAAIEVVSNDLIYA